METTKTTLNDDRMKEEMKGFLCSMYDLQAFKIGDFLVAYRHVLETKQVIVPNIQKLYNLFYSVKDDLEKEGLIKVIKQGIYYINSKEGVDDYDEDDEEELVETDKGESEEPIAPETRVIGEGEGSIYLYYYPAYKDLAELRGESEYRCKLGMTSQGVEKRFSTSTKTEEPENRRIALVIYTDHPSDLEKMLHSALKISGKALSDTPGREWFLTNPDEVESIYNAVLRLPDRAVIEL